MGRFFNQVLKDMHRIPSGMEKMRQDFILKERNATTAIVECPDKVEPMTPNQIRMAKVRAARKNVVTANS